MNKICTSLEQSKKLIELGIDIHTADMHYYKNSFGDYIEGLYNSSDLKEGCELKGIEYIPAWSLTSLLGQLKSKIRLENKQILFLHLNKYDDTDYEIRYTNSWTGEVFIIEADNLVDACVEMIIKLKEKDFL